MLNSFNYNNFILFLTNKSFDAITELINNLI